MEFIYEKELLYVVIWTMHTRVFRYPTRDQ